MSVMLMTSFASYPRRSSQRLSHRPRISGTALPTWMRVYTVGPQKYIRIGPGGGGSSRFERVKVSYSRIEPPQGLVARQRGDHRSELRPPLPTGQREPQRPEVAAGRLQLAHERLRRVVAERAVRAGA